jgi:hypothetical protein
MVKKEGESLRYADGMSFNENVIEGFLLASDVYMA